MPRRFVSLLLTGLVLAGCGSTTTRQAPPPPRVSVMTQNLYTGAYLNPLFDPTKQFAAEAVKVLLQVQQSDFPARAVGIANEIKAHQPDLIGLQEVALWQTGPSCERLSPTNTGGVDYLATLLARLQQQGAPYQVAAQNTEFSAAATVAGLCASLTLRDVILARADLPATVKLSNPQGHHYGDYPAPAGSPAGTKTEMQIAFPVSGQPQTIPLHRGWTSVDVTVDGRTFRFADTHLEGYSAQYRDIQAKLFAQYAAGASPVPMIASGDYNFAPAAEGGTGTLAGSSLTDAWPLAARPGDPGNTAGQDDSLRNVPSKIDHRVDYILYTPGKTRPVPLSGVIVGNQTSDMVPASAGNPKPGPLWPSDHAGMILTLEIL